ncbi:MAG: lysophospholipid acyltransferase family protein [Candidatus Binatia bacterium]
MKLIAAKDPYLLLVVSLVRVATWLSSRRLTLLLVNSIAFLAYRLSRAKRRLCEKNLVEAFGGDLGKHRMRRIVHSSFRQFWVDTFAVPRSGVSETALQSATIRGLEHLRSALSKGNGAILWETSYFGRRLLAKQILRQNGFEITQVHADFHMGGFAGGGTTSWLRQRFVRGFFEDCEKPFVKEILYLRSQESLAFTKALTKRLRENAVICISADGRRGHKFVAVPFLGHTVFFPTGIVSLAKLSGAAILPLFCLQEDNDESTLVIECPIAITADRDRERGFEKSIQQYAGLLECYVKKYPQQYRNWHNPSGVRQRTVE